MKVFLSDLSLRPSCYACKAKGGRSSSDLTIADFWGIQTLISTMDDDKGIGLVFIQSDKGEEFFPYLHTISCESSYEKVKYLNPSCFQSVAMHPNRTRFFKKLGHKPFALLEKEYNKPTVHHRLLTCHKKYLLY